MSYQVSRLISSGEEILNWSVDRKKAEIGIFGHAIKAFAASLCQQTGGQFCHGIGCNICPKRPTYYPLSLNTEGGNVGIGTSSPGFPLDVLGQVNTSAVATGAGVGTLQIQGAKSDTHGLTLSFDNSSNSAVLNNFYSGPLTLKTANSERLRIDASGNVGIGTTTPDEALSVAGTVHAKEVKVSLSGLPDYVFKSSYHLLTLPEVKTYIAKNHHLPDVPSAEEVEKNGLNLGEMDKVLTKKVEELTLYLIEKDRQIEKQLKESSIQKAKLQSQERKIRALEVGLKKLTK